MLPLAVMLMLAMFYFGLWAMHNVDVLMSYVTPIVWYGLLPMAAVAVLVLVVDAIRDFDRNAPK